MAQSFFLHFCASSPSFSVFGAQCFSVSSFPCDQLGKVKVKVPVFSVVVVVGDIQGTHLRHGAFWCMVDRADQVDP